MTNKCYTRPLQIDRTFLFLLALLCALTLPRDAFGQKTQKDYFNLTDAKISKSDWDGVIEDYTKAIELNPKLNSGYYNRGIANATKGAGLDNAIADSTKAIKFDPVFIDAYKNRGNAKREKGD